MGSMTTSGDERQVSEENGAAAFAGEAGSIPIVSAEDQARIAIIVSHPIQYFAPWYRALASIEGVALKVLFCSRQGAETYFDPDFGIEVKWDIPLLDGYEWEFLASRKEIQRLTFWATDNPNINDALERFRPTVVVVHCYAHRTMWRAVSWCNRNRIPVMLSSDSNATEKRALWKRAAKAIVVGHLYRHLDGAFSCGDNNRMYHLQYGIPKERIFPGTLPIDCGRLVASVGERDEARREIRKLHGIPEDAFVVVYAGKLTSLKCPSHLIDAVRRCAHQGVQVWGLLVGEGAERPMLEAMIAGHKLKTVVLAGFINQSAIGKYYAASQVVSLMSRYEPKGLIVPEAGCFGCPAILSDRVGCIGPTDSARPGENALVYPWSDIDALAKCILQLYKDHSMYRTMSEAAVKIAYSQDVSAAAVQLKESAVQLKKMGCR